MMQKNVHRIVELSEGIMIFLVLLALIAVSVFAAISAMPHGKENISEDPDTSVAGEDSEITGVSFVPLYDEYRHDIEFFTNEETSAYTFEIIPKSLDEGTLISPLVRIDNFNDFAQEFSIESILTGNIQENIELYLQIGEKKLPIFVDGIVSKNLFEIERQSAEEINLVYEIKRRVNFPFNVNLQFRIL